MPYLAHARRQQQQQQRACWQVLVEGSDSVPEARNWAETTQVAAHAPGRKTVIILHVPSLKVARCIPCKRAHDRALSAVRHGQSTPCARAQEQHQHPTHAATPLFPGYRTHKCTCAKNVRLIGRHFTYPIPKDCRASAKRRARRATSEYVLMTVGPSTVRHMTSCWPCLDRKSSKMKYMSVN